MAATIGFYLSGVIAIAIIFIGCRFLLAPSMAAAAYGVPAGSAHVLGWFMLAATLIPVADAVIVLQQGGSRTVAFGVHGGTAVAMLIISGLLLID